MIVNGGEVMTALLSHLSAGELEARYERAADPVSKSHFHAIWLLSSGYEITEVAATLSFSARWVRLLSKRWRRMAWARKPGCTRWRPARV